MAIVKFKGSVISNLPGKSDWARLEQMTDIQIKIAAATDPSMGPIDRTRLFKVTKNFKIKGVLG